MTEKTIKDIHKEFNEWAENIQKDLFDFGYHPIHTDLAPEKEELKGI